MAAEISAATKLDRIRARVSYQKFKKLADGLKQRGSTNEAIAFALDFVDNMIDDMQGYRSDTRAAYAEESKDQLKIDLNLK